VLEKLKDLLGIKPKSDTWSNLSRYEKDCAMDDLLERLEVLEDDNQSLITELGDISAYCDKCEGSKTVHCLKCEGTGIVKKKQLLNWPWM